MKLLHAVIEGVYAVRDFTTELVLAGFAAVWMLFISADLFDDQGEDADSWHGEDR